MCALYGLKETNVNLTRLRLFEQKQKKGIVIDLSNIPPCRATLLLQMERANYVAKLWKMAGMVDAPSPVGYGWDDDSGIQ